MKEWMKKWGKKLWPTLVAALVAATAAIYWQYGGQGSKVELIAPRLGVLQGTVKETGYLVPRGDYIWYPPGPTTVLEAPKKPGDRVVKGELILRLDDRSLREELNRLQGELEALQVTMAGKGTQAMVEAAREGVRQAQMRLQELEAQYERERALTEAGAKAPAELETLGNQVEAARSQLVQAQAAERQAAAMQDQGEYARRMAALQEAIRGKEKDLAELEVRAPFDGVLVEGRWSVGQKLDGQTPAVRLVGPGALEVQVDVIHEEAWKIAEGQAVTLFHRGSHTQAAGKVERIGGRAEAKVSPLGLEQRRVAVTVGVEAMPELWKEGYPLEVVFPWTSREGVIIPKGAMIPAVDGAFVFKAVDGKAVKTPVVVYAMGEEEVMIAEGLTPQDQVVAASQGIQDGQEL